MTVEMPFSKKSERLKRKRRDAGFKTASAFAKHVGVSDVTYRSHELPPERPGARGFNEAYARIYGEALNISWIWLLHGSEAE